ncbi:MAG: iron-containing alcohol dehydrogenase [Oscillospiraceae bacterium]|nr:iron-containing alcohol dehydrogenase [Oscillospiraceae bacterium]
MNIKNAAYRGFQKTLKLATYALDWTPPAIIRGAGSIKKLPQVIRRVGFDNVLIVTDKGLMGIGLLNSLFDALKWEGIQYTVYDGTQPNPTIENIEEGRKLYVANRCQAIIAFGGGSPMDCAKGIGARIARPGLPVEKMRGLLKINKTLPVIFAVPTTAGTGSETTLAAVITNAGTHEKYPINDNKLIPKFAVIDPELTLGLPPHLTAPTGLDALTHAVEAFIGKSNTPATEQYAKDAVRLIFSNLLTAYEDGKNLQARENMLLASFYAGAAFTRAYVGYAHSIAHCLGGLYGVPHGLANAIILPNLLDFYGETAHARLAVLCDEAGLSAGLSTEKEKAEAFIAEIRRYNKRMSIPEKFDMIEEKDLPTIVGRSLKEANPLYPVPKIMDKKACEAFIRSLIA